MGLKELLDLGDTVTTVGICVAGLAAFIRGWIVPGALATRLIKERNEWQQIAVEAMKLSNRAVSVVADNGRSSSEER